MKLRRRCHLRSDVNFPWSLRCHGWEGEVKTLIPSGKEVISPNRKLLENRIEVFKRWVLPRTCSFLGCCAFSSGEGSY